jgi:aromatic ring-cleaving dioxygenase
MQRDIVTEGPNAKSYINPPSTTKSTAYSAFPSPITNDTRGGFDIHIYFLHTNADEAAFATALWERIRREFPELRIYRLWEKPIGPHPVAMFEVNLFTPEQFGAFVPWLVINRGPLSALVHPNTGDGLRDHSQRATWMGQPLPLQLGLLAKLEKKRAERQEQANGS